MFHIDLLFQLLNKYLCDWLVTKPHIAYICCNEYWKLGEFARISVSMVFGRLLHSYTTISNLEPEVTALYKNTTILDYRFF